MTPLDVLARLKAEGLTATLKVRLEGDAEPSPETLALFRAHRDDLITYLAHADMPQMCRLSEELKDGAVWCRRCWRYHLNACVPSEKQLGDLKNVN